MPKHREGAKDPSRAGTSGGLECASVYSWRAWSFRPTGACMMAGGARAATATAFVGHGQ